MDVIAENINYNSNNFLFGVTLFLLFTNLKMSERLSREKIGDTRIHILNNENFHFTRFSPFVARTWHVCKHIYHRIYRIM